MEELIEKYIHIRDKIGDYNKQLDHYKERLDNLEEEIDSIKESNLDSKVMRLTKSSHKWEVIIGVLVFIETVVGLIMLYNGLYH